MCYKDFLGSITKEWQCIPVGELTFKSAAQIMVQKFHYLSCALKTIHFCWIPSRIGIRENEAADVAAKESLDQDITVIQVKAPLGEWSPGFRESRKEEVVLSRLRIGNTYFPHSCFTSGRSS